jgi:integrase
MRPTASDHIAFCGQRLAEADSPVPVALPAFERAALGRIDTLAVREWIAGLVEHGLSPSRIRNAHQVLSQILAAGVEGGRIARNPAAGVRLPRIVRRDMHFLSARQVQDLAAAIDPRYGLLVRFAAYTGLRAGELVALRVRHLNLVRGRCEVGESATEVDGRLVLGPTKTYARRMVPLPRFLCEQLAAYLAERPHGPDDLVFTAPQDGPLREQKFVAGIFKPAAAKAGLPNACGSMIFGTPARACSSPRARASRRSRPSSAMLRQR